MTTFKVMHILRPAEGGMKNHVENLLKHVNQGIYESVLVCPATVAAKMDTACKVYNLELTENLTPGRDIKALNKLMHIINMEKPNILHTHGTKTGVLARLAAKRFGGTLCTVSTIHNFVYQFPTSWLKGKLFSYFQRQLIPQADHYIAVSKALADNVCFHESIPADKMSVVYNGVNLKDFEMMLDCNAAKEALHLDIREPVVGVIARLIPQKGVQHFLKMADTVSKKLPGCQFLIIGSGPQRDALVDQAYDMGIEARIIFCGYRKDIPMLLPIINVLVIPSLSEGLSITALEAMASRRPIVAYNTGGLSELIINEETGLVVKKGDINGLSRSVLELLIHRQKAERLGNTARQIVEERFTLDKMIKDTEKIYEKVLLSKGLKIAETIEKEAAANLNY
ncbi:glycosyltransferase family 4 protein [Desulfitibacter alkalitolerans]|uniref:glycosyltransferase family 4 protein n=1 Tax=Desulfitibacter alkalitolerans TaxID=264641 RepID=UPI00048573AF|nr:glycosyltransferase family 4 protein [Desulfitibacter alkalitolerans]